MDNREIANQRFLHPFYETSVRHHLRNQARSRRSRRSADHSTRARPSHPGALRRHRARKPDALEKIFRRRLHLLQRERTHHGQGETGCRHHAYAGGIFRLDQDRQCPEPDFGRHRSSELRRHETETIFGQNLTARYHVTDTWLRRNDEWKIIASQAHRYYEDPAVGKADPRKFGDFIGTYELAPGQIRSITVENENLFIERKGKKEQLLPETSDLFFRKSIEGRILFHYDANGKVDSLADRRNNEDVIWRKIK